MGAQPKYRIYPSLLDKFQSLLDYEQETEAPWNVWTEKKVTEYVAECERQNADAAFPIPIVPPTVGDLILAPDEMYEKIENELIASINREPHEPSEAADRGTALNEIVDCLILGKQCPRDDMTIRSLKKDGQPYAIRATIDGFVFDFDISLCRELRDALKGGICQYLVSADLETQYGTVTLYGYLDYWIKDAVIDLKTTSRYNFGNYERKWQRYVYPYCCIESGGTDNISEFIYLAVQLSGNPIIKGTIYPESYDYNHENCKIKLTQFVERFIEWLESVRDRITDKKIFNEL